MSSLKSKSPVKKVSLGDLVGPDLSSDAMAVIMAAFDRAAKEQNRILRKAQRLEKTKSN